MAKLKLSLFLNLFVSAESDYSNTVGAELIILLMTFMSLHVGH